MSLYQSKPEPVSAGASAVGGRRRWRRTMRNISVWVLATLGAVALASSGCSAGGAGAGSTTKNSKPGSTGGAGNTPGGGTSATGTGSGGPDLTPDQGNDGPEGAPEDPDPGNPNITHPKCGNGKCTDFPAEPILAMGAPANSAMLFGDPSNFDAGAICVIEPQLSNGATEGAMMPANWVRPRFRASVPAGIDLLEIRIHSPVEKNDLVVYTPAAKTGPAASWYMPKEYWAGNGAADAPAAGNGFANNAAGQPVTVTIRGVNSAAPGKPIGITGTFNIAPVVATGSMVFWTVNSA